MLYLRPLLEHLRLVVEEVMKVQLIPNDMSFCSRTTEARGGVQTIPWLKLGSPDKHKSQLDTGFGLIKCMTNSMTFHPQALQRPAASCCVNLAF